MQQNTISRKKAVLIIIAGLGGLVLVIGLISFLLKGDENQFGKFITIQNYSAKINNMPGSVRDATESYLYNVVVMNVDESVNASKISDAKIREDSNTQDYSRNVYTGSYIVDIESIKQSYGVTYTYSQDESELGGNPIVVSCLPKEDLIYGEFKCTDIVSKQEAPNQDIMRYLPYENFSYKITPDATQGDTLVLVVKFDIPQSDLKGNAASRAEVIAMYKKEVTDWILSKGVDPDKYILQYNYDDAGNLIVEEEVVGD